MIGTVCFIVAGYFLGVALSAVTPPLPTFTRGPTTPLLRSDMRMILGGVAAFFGAMFFVAQILRAFGV